MAPETRLILAGSLIGGGVFKIEEGDLERGQALIAPRLAFGGDHLAAADGKILVAEGAPGFGAFRLDAMSAKAVDQGQCDRARAVFTVGVGERGTQFQFGVIRRFETALLVAGLFQQSRQAGQSPMVLQRGPVVVGQRPQAGVHRHVRLQLRLRRDRAAHQVGEGQGPPLAGANFLLQPEALIGQGQPGLDHLQLGAQAQLLTALHVDGFGFGLLHG